MSRRLPLRHLLMGAAMAIVFPAAVQADPVAIINARILSVGPAGDIAHGTVVFDQGRITAVGATVVVPAGARVIDAKGRTLTPGLVASGTNLGLNEISSVAPANDSRAAGRTISAAFDVAPGLNPASSNIPVARRGGVAYAVAAPAYPSGDAARELPFAGQAALISLDGAEAPTAARIAMVLDFGEDGAARSGGARGAERALVDSYFDDVLVYQRNPAAYERGALREFSLSRADMEALAPVLAGRQPLLIGVSRASDILQVLDLARSRKLNIILTGVEEGWMVAKEIAAAGVPVILNPTSNLPTSYETLGATLTNAAQLNAAGVRIAFTGNDETFRVRELRYNAGVAVAHGLPYAAAIEAITLNPAKMFGHDERIGSIAPGKAASLVLWSGDPLEPMSQAEMMFINGEEQALEQNRPALLRDKYLAPAQPEGDMGR